MSITSRVIAPPPGGAKVASMASAGATAGVGPLLRDWRQRRRLSQLDLALDAGVSARHLSFVETGRARPSADMVLQLADRLEVPLRERNQLLMAAGHAPSSSSALSTTPRWRPFARRSSRSSTGTIPIRRW